jgi:succinyl-CoA synthetase alpha subunit
MGHAGAIILGGKETAEAKLAALRDAGIEVAENNKAPAGCLQRGLVESVREAC